MHYGVSLFPQYTTWSDMKNMALSVEEWGYDSLWTWDHFLPIHGDATGPNFEGWQILPAWAALTKRIRLGMLVSGNTYRHPAVLANMAATLDHISEGRAILGMGAAWFELEHNQYGIDFGKSPGERLARLGEALPIVRSLLDNRLTTFEGKFYQVRDAMAEPKPLQKKMPIMIGGGGEQKTLRLVARYADYWNGFGPPQVVENKLAILKSHCQEAGTDFNHILTTVVLNVVIRDTEAESAAREQMVLAHHRMTQANPNVSRLHGTPQEIATQIHEYARVGIKGIILGGPPPYDRITMERFQKEVKPLVESLSQTSATV